MYLLGVATSHIIFSPPKISVALRLTKIELNAIPGSWGQMCGPLIPSHLSRQPCYSRVYFRLKARFFTGFKCLLFRLFKRARLVANLVVLNCDDNVFWVPWFVWCRFLLRFTTQASSLHQNQLRVTLC